MYDQVMEVFSDMAYTMHVTEVKLMQYLDYKS